MVPPSCVERLTLVARRVRAARLSPLSTTIARARSPLLHPPLFFGARHPLEKQMPRRSQIFGRIAD
jgi:hypothetical protein